MSVRGYDVSARKRPLKASMKALSVGLPGLRNVHAVKPGRPLLEGRRAQTVFPAQIHHRNTGLLPAQDPDDLFLAGACASLEFVSRDRFILSVHSRSGL